MGKGKPIKEIKENKEQLRPPSQQFESNRPHWILRVVSDSNNAVSIVSMGTVDFTSPNCMKNSLTEITETIFKDSC